MATQRRYEIFVSSTFEDLIEERRELQEYIISQGNVPVGMELFSAGYIDQWKIIQKVIDECDYYVLMIAGRYGSVSPADGISYTEKEFLYAKKRKKPIIVFILSDRGAEKLALEKREDAPKLQEKLAAFRSRLKKEGLVYFWDDARDLARKIERHLPAWIASVSQPGWVRATAVDSVRREQLASRYVVNALKPHGRRLEVPQECQELYPLSTRLEDMHSVIAAINALMIFYVKPHLAGQIRIYFAYKLMNPVDIDIPDSGNIRAEYRLAISTTREKPWQRGLCLSRSSNVHRVYESGEPHIVFDADDPRTVNQRVSKEGSVYAVPVSYGDESIGVVGVSSPKPNDVGAYLALTNHIDALLEALFFAYGQHAGVSGQRPTVDDVRKEIAAHFERELPPLLAKTIVS